MSSEGVGWGVAAGVCAALCGLSWLWTRLRAPGFHVEHKHVFITGGSNGIGLSLAKQYAAAGAMVSIIARSTEQLDAARHQIEDVSKHSHAVFTQSCDVTDYAAVQKAVADANVFHERVTDHVICNAGITEPGLMLEQDVAVFRCVMDVNYFGVVHTVKAALPAMIANPMPETSKDRRHVIIVSSALGLMSFIGFSQYAASKFAVRGLGEALRNELQLYDIHTTMYYPGNVTTAMFAKENETKPLECRRIDGSSVPMPPDEAAATLIRGIARGEFAVTNEFLLWVLRVLANGAPPRSNTPLEILLLPLFVLVQLGFGRFMDGVVDASRKKRQNTDQT